jgi:2-dehydro-3-deoxyphosphooctonate aldolase (KDO 8-P synthase)
VVDYRAIPIIQEKGTPVIFDCTHSVQLPSGAGGVSSGQRQFIPTLTKAAIAAGCQGLFMEVHPNPDKALSDGATQIPLANIEEFLKQCLKLHASVSGMVDIALPQQGKCVELAPSKI